MLNPLRRLASQTAIYGLSSVVGRFLNYLLVPLLTYSFAPADYGVVAEFYAYMGFLAVLLTFGLETGYFRFRARGEWPHQRVYANVLGVLLLANGLFLLAVVLWRDPLAALLRHPGHGDYLWWCAAILALDALGAAAFARLRAEERALRFALVKLIEIGANIGLTLWFVVLCRAAFERDPGSALGQWWNPEIGIGYVFLANLAASALKFALLAPQWWRGFGRIDPVLLARLLRYSLPMVVIGLAGIVNEMLDRAALKYLLPGDPESNLAQLGIYSACYKLSILMALFIQAFRYAGEPFFFSQAQRTDARALYALVMTWFVICCMLIFLVVTLYLDLFQYFVGPAYREGLHVVPILLLAGVLLGIQVNLSIWYKLSDRTLLGAGVALVGALVTVALLWWWVPLYGYVGAAWAHLACYTTMVLLSWLLGRHFYPVPYDLGRILGYLALGVGLVLAHPSLSAWLGGASALAGALCIGLYLAIVALADGRRLRRFAQN